ncbi:MAG: hypothetical protein ACO3A2_09965 [Bdellovibrionia bacterium]
MIHRFLLPVVIGVSFVCFPLHGIPLVFAEQKRSSESKSAEWKAKMQGLLQLLSENLADLTHEDSLKTPQGKVRFENHAKKLASLAHDLTRSSSMPGASADPTVRMLSGVFASETEHAYQELKRGNQRYAREILRAVSGYCVACHTAGERKNAQIPESDSLSQAPFLTRLRAVERGDFFAAARQFDRALKEYDSVLSSELKTSGLSLDWQRAVQQSLSIAVRVKKDPVEALSLVQRVLAHSQAPFYYRQNAIQWQKSLEEWKAEGERTAGTEEGLYREAVRLVAQARSVQKYPLDRSADMIYFRATSVLHDLLRIAPEGAHAAEALFMAGMCYQVLRPLQLEEFHEFYFQSCIKKSPHTPLSELCYQRYEESVFSGYTGSSGVFIPSDVQQQLSQWETLAHPLNPTQK